MGAYEYQGAYEPTSPDLFGRLKEFHYYKFGEQIVVDVEVRNRGTDAERLKVAFFLSENGVTLGQSVSEDTVMGGLKSGHTRTVTCKYSSATPLSGKYIIAVIDSEDQITETVETNNRIRARIP
jgi:hypothetical protein